jgi:hypothetical protein
MQGKIFDRGIENIANGINPTNSKGLTLVIKFILYLLPVVLIAAAFGFKVYKKSKKKSLHKFESAKITIGKTQV